MDEELPFKDQSQIAISASKKTSVRRIDHEFGAPENPKNFVLKIRTKNIPRLNNESDEAYSKRRLNDSMEFVAKERRMETIVERILRDNKVEVSTPREEWFIYQGGDGFPTAARIQEEVSGQTLRDFGVDNLNPDQKRKLASLLEANEKCFQETGKNIDLLGVSSEDRFDLRIKQLTIGAIRYSVNILVSDGKLVLVDAKLGERSDWLGMAKRIRLKMDLASLRKQAEGSKVVDDSVLLGTPAKAQG